MNFLLKLTLISIVIIKKHFFKPFLKELEKLSKALKVLKKKKNKLKNIYSSYNQISFKDLWKKDKNKDDVKFIVSGYTCCGIIWLTNLLSEFGVISPEIIGYNNIGDIDDQIYKKNNKFYVKTKVFNPYIYRVCGNIFGKSEYEINLDMAYSWKGQNLINISESINRKCIIMVRDPRDIAISRYLLDKAELDEAEKNNIESDEENEIFFRKIAMSTIEIWVKFYENALSLYGKNIKFIRFEDRLLDPDKTAREIIKFLNLDFVSEEMIHKAIISSSFENSKKIEEKILNNNVELVFDKRPYFVSGKSFKYKDPEYAIFQDVFKQMSEYGEFTMSKFGYKAD